MARAFEVPMYQLFYDGDEPPKLPNLPKKSSDDMAWGSTGKDARYAGTPALWSEIQVREAGKAVYFLSPHKSMNARIDGGTDD
jgi:hypothetical protein